MAGQKMKATGELGETIPAGDIHAISVSLPTWESTLGWATRDPVVLSKMRTGYPRFFIHRFIDELAGKLVTKYRAEHEHEHENPDTEKLGMLFPAKKYAVKCAEYLKREFENEKEEGKEGEKGIKVLTAGLPGLWRCASESKGKVENDNGVRWEDLELHIVLYPSSLARRAKAFWQHTGYGISSRYAEFYLQHLGSVMIVGEDVCCSYEELLLTFNGNEDRQEVAKSVKEYIEESEKLQGREIVRKRIVDLQVNEIGVENRDVFIYHTGMCAFANVAEMIKTWGGNMWGEEVQREVVCYGFLYVDTFKILSTIPLPTLLLGHASPSDLATLQTRLPTHPISALIVEVPQNPLLGTPDIFQLRYLADLHNFLIIVDDTVGTCVILDVLKYADVVVTSLSKMFSGKCDVMGGSVVVNPQCRHAGMLRKILTSGYWDTYFPPDAAIMAQNSTSFEARVLKASANASRILSLLRAHPSVKEVYYPQGSPTQANFDAVRRPPSSNCSPPAYSFLLSLIFHTPVQAHTFYNALSVSKGPSLGTDFTLSCAYTLLAHYGEREWAEKYGVLEDLVRISVGLEDGGWLEQVVGEALEAVEKLGL